MAEVPDALRLGEWAHIALVASTNGVRLFVNGVLVTTNEAPLDCIRRRCCTRSIACFPWNGTTIWYGVFDRPIRRLTYASGGHPPALLTGAAPAELAQLSTGGPLWGMDPAAEFRDDSCAVQPGSRLYVFNDGACEIALPDGTTAKLADLVHQLCQPSPPGQSKLDELIQWARVTGGQTSFQDDVSIMESEF